MLVGDREDVLAGTATLLVLRDASETLDQVVQAAAIAARIDSALDDAGVDEDTIHDIQDQHPVDQTALLPADPNRIRRPRSRSRRSWCCTGSCSGTASGSRRGDRGEVLEGRRGAPLGDPRGS